MNSEKEAVPRDSSAGGEKNLGREPGVEACIPLSVREARRARSMRADVWPHIWLSFASIIILALALAILSYRMGAQSCR
jgi:hypothetical protein